MSRPVQLAAAKALEAGNEWYAENNARYAVRREVGWQILDALHCSYDKKQVGMFLWGKIPDKYESAEELTEQVLQERHVFITPGFIFGTNGSRYVRISLCADVTMLKNALKRIQDLKL